VEGYAQSLSDVLFEGLRPNACASLHALKSIPQLLAPAQVGFGVPRGIEAAVHAARVYLSNLPQHHGLLKIDFTNYKAFNSIRRDKMLAAVSNFIPDLLHRCLVVADELRLFHLESTLHIQHPQLCCGMTLK
jgi:hypothetical protein